MATLNISMPDTLREWVDTRVRDGHYATASDYLRDLVRRDQTEAEKLATLRAAIDSGRASGISERTLDDIVADLRARLAPRG